MIQVTKNQLKPASGAGSNWLQAWETPSTWAMSSGFAPLGSPLDFVFLFVIFTYRQASPSGGPATPCSHSIDLDISAERASFQTTLAEDLGLHFTMLPLVTCSSQPVAVARRTHCSDWPALIMWSPTEPRDDVSPTKISWAKEVGWFLKEKLR